MSSIAKKILVNPIFFIILIALGVLSLFAIFENRITNGNMGAPLDDVFIHFQFSKNLSEGKGLSFNPGEQTSGSTAPVWTLIITFPFLLLKNHLLIAKSVSAIFFIATGVVTYYLGFEITKNRKLGFLSAILTLVAGRFAWSALSGMEVTMFTFVLTSTLLLYVKQRSSILLAALLGLSSTIRPEGYVLFGFFAVAELITKYKEFGFARAIKNLLIPTFVYCAIIAPYLIFSYITSGYILPNTFRAQSAEAYDLFFKIKLTGLYLYRYTYLVFTDNPAIALLLPFGLFSLLKKYKKDSIKVMFVLLVAVGFPLVASIMAPNLRHHGRYTMPFVPLYTVIGMSGINITLRIIRLFIKKFKLNAKNTFSKVIVVFISVVYAIYMGSMLFVWSDTFGWNVKNINDLHRHLGNWVSENTKEDDILAINDIGAITYISQREIIDTVGLVSPEVLDVMEGKTKDEREEALWQYLVKKEPEYIIIFPSWYPLISEKEELEEIHRVTHEKYTIIDGEMVVYKTNFNQSEEME